MSHLAELTEVISFFQLCPYFSTYVDDTQLVWEGTRQNGSGKKDKMLQKWGSITRQPGHCPLVAKTERNGKLVGINPCLQILPSPVLFYPSSQPQFGKSSLRRRLRGAEGWNHSRGRTNACLSCWHWFVGQRAMWAMKGRCLRRCGPPRDKASNSFWRGD